MSADLRPIPARLRVGAIRGMITRADGAVFCHYRPAYANGRFSCGSRRARDFFLVEGAEESFCAECARRVALSLRYEARVGAVPPDSYYHDALPYLRRTLETPC